MAGCLNPNGACLRTHETILFLILAVQAPESKSAVWVPKLLPCVAVLQDPPARLALWLLACGSEVLAYWLQRHWCNVFLDREDSREFGRR